MNNILNRDQNLVCTCIYLYISFHWQYSLQYIGVFVFLALLCVHLIYIYALAIFPHLIQILTHAVLICVATPE